MLIVAKLEIENEGILEKIAKVRKIEADLDMALSELDDSLQKYRVKEIGESEDTPVG